MTFTKIKNFTEKDEIRIKAAGKYIENNTKSGQLAIYIGGEVYLNFFGDDKKIDITYGYSPITKERTILLSKLKEGKKGYSSHITGNGRNQTRKLVISVDKYFINKNDYNNKPVSYVVNKNGEIELYIDNIYSKRKTKDKVYFEGGEVNVNDVASKIAKNIKPKTTKVFKDNKEIILEPGNYINIEQEKISNELILKELNYLKEQVDLINEKTNQYFKTINLCIDTKLDKQSTDIKAYFDEIIRYVKILKIKIDTKGYDKNDTDYNFYKTNQNANIPDTNLVHNIELIKIVINSEMRKIIKEYDKNTEKKDKRSLFSRIFG